MSHHTSYPHLKISFNAWLVSLPRDIARQNMRGFSRKLRKKASFRTLSTSFRHGGWTISPVKHGREYIAKRHALCYSALNSRAGEYARAKSEEAGQEAFEASDR